MPINPNIALGGGSGGVQIQDPLNAFAKFMQIQNMQSEQSMNRMKMDEYQRGLEDENSMRQFLRGADLTSPETRRGLVRYGKKGADLGKAISDQETAELQRQKAFADAVSERMKMSRLSLEGVNTPEMYLAWHESNHKDPILGVYLAQRGVTAEQSRAKIMEAMSRPGGFEQMLSESKIGAEKALERHFAEQNTGGSLRQISTPKYGSGPATEVPGSRVTTTMTPYQKAQIGAEYTRIGQEKAPTLTEVVDPEDPSKMIKVDARTYKGGGMGAPGVVGRAGKEPGVGINLSQKDVRAREAKFPQAQGAVKGTEQEMDDMVKDLMILKDHPGLDGITGLIYGRTPGITAEARAAEALFKKIIARGGFSKLAEMRAASPTGGALGNVSDTEGRYLREAFSNLSTTQAKPDFQKAIEAAIEATERSKQRVREAFDTTYEYRQASQPAAADGVDASNPLLK